MLAQLFLSPKRIADHTATNTYNEVNHLRISELEDLYYLYSKILSAKICCVEKYIHRGNEKLKKIFLLHIH